jgi:hypothetical protein
VTYKRNVAGFDLTISVEIPAVAKLAPGEEARLRHQCELTLANFSRRIIEHVVNYPARRLVLRRLTHQDAELLNLLPKWREAQKTTD